MKTVWIIESWTGSNWTDDASLLGHGLDQNANDFASKEDAKVAIATLCHPSVGLDWRNLRVAEIARQS